MQAEGDPGSPLLLQDARGGSPQLSWREAGVRTGLLLSEAPSWGYTRAQPERDSGSVCRLLSPVHEGSCGQHRQNLLGDCSFLFPKTSLDVVRVPSPLFTRCRISSRALQPLCVCVCFLVCFFFFFFAGTCAGVEQFFRPVLVQWPLCCVIQPLVADQDHQLRGLLSSAACYDFTCDISPFFVQTSP